jgi:hypothetical protein
MNSNELNSNAASYVGPRIATYAGLEINPGRSFPAVED